VSTLAGKVALVTGASSGIGRETALLFAREGAKVVVGARRETALDALVGEIRAEGQDAVAVAGDVRELAYAERLVAAAVDTFGGLDVAVNNAGILGPSASVEEISVADWHEVIDTNLTGAFLGARSQVPALRRRGGGSLIFVSSFVGYTITFPGSSAYAAGKAGLIGLVKALAVDLGADGIRANALLPGSVLTPMHEAACPTAEERDALRRRSALQRVARPEELARSALYLASEASSFTTGTAMLVDGGISVHG
jgi:NAD(P)-dependent dehydrogenase (short-subunit alcohol dehydrogenase family)